MCRERLLNTLALTFSALALTWYLYENIGVEYRDQFPDKYGRVQVITKLHPTAEAVSYRLSELKVESGKTFHTKVVKLEKCRFIDSKNWDCYQSYPDWSEDQPKMLNGTLNRWGQGEMDRYLVLPIIGAVKL
jgi:hypothetical protein